METASGLSGGIVLVNLVREGQDLTFSQNYACEDCGISIEELTPRMFSFNNPFGACPTCTGLGMQLKADPDLIIPDPSCPFWRAPSRPRGWNYIRDDGISPDVFRGPGARNISFSLHTPGGRAAARRSWTSSSTAPRARSWSCTMTSARGRGTLYQPFEGVAQQSGAPVSGNPVRRHASRSWRSA